MCDNRSPLTGRRTSLPTIVAEIAMSVFVVVAVLAMSLFGID
jgi:hypothetical protein